MFTRFWRSGQRGGTGSVSTSSRASSTRTAGPIAVGRRPTSAGPRCPSGSPRTSPTSSATHRGTEPFDNLLRLDECSATPPRARRKVTMSGPNSDYDPVEVTPLHAEEVEAMRDAALAAIAAADPSTRSRRSGSRTPATAPRSRWPTARSAPSRRRRARTPAAGRPGPRGRHRRRSPTVPRSSRPSARRGCWSTRPSTSRCPRTATPVGARHPLTTIQEQVADVFVAMGWEVAEGPEVEAEWLNFDALNLGPDHPARTMQDTFFLEPREGRVVLRTHTSPVQARTMLDARAADLRHLPRPGLPHRRARRDPHAGVPPGRGPRGRRGPHDGAPQGHARPLRRRRCSATACTTRLRPSYFPFTEPSAEVDLLCFVCHGVPRRSRTAAPAAARAGSSGAAAAWSTRAC